MGIVVSSDRLRPYQTVPAREMDEETGHVSINLEVPQQNGVPAVAFNEFANKRWKKMFGGTQQHRFAPKGNGR